MNCTGRIDCSILLVAGVHARLESISKAGTWLHDHEFVLGKQTVQRKEGQSVGNIMQQWRQARQDSPELFTGADGQPVLRMWQSPSAMVDGVIWQWQQAEESSRYTQAVRQVDALRTCWSQKAEEMNF